MMVREHPFLFLIDNIGSSSCSYCVLLFSLTLLASLVLDRQMLLQGAAQRGGATLAAPATRQVIYGLLLRVTLVMVSSLLLLALLVTCQAYLASLL